MSSIPTEVRLRSPPEMPLSKALPAMVSAHLLRPKVSSMPFTNSSRSATVPGRLMYAENSMHSRTVSVAIKRSSCITYAMLDLKSFRLMIPPATETSPLSGMGPPEPEWRCRPPRMFRSVDLPLPEGPSTAVRCPGSMTPVMFFKISLPPIAKFMFVHSMERGAGSPSSVRFERFRINRPKDVVPAIPSTSGSEAGSPLCSTPSRACVRGALRFSAAPSIL
mmetsp:Transcript_143551/g.459112  ORF Transcript_143551/g.459112 Transcript_143551/m.459112 type:complete len:221 (+) Transcript_143551:1756-2418(+)